jgi:hypothetical protein
MRHKKREAIMKRMLLGERYTQKAIAEKLIDQQVRDIDIGKARIGIGMVAAGWKSRRLIQSPSTTRSARSIT